MMGNLRKSARLRTVPETYFRNSDSLGDKPAILYKKDNKWLNLTYSNLTGSIVSLATSLAQRGLKKGDKVAIISENRYEYYITEIAVISCGAVAVPLYLNAAPSQIEFILNDCSADFLFFSPNKNTTKKIANLKQSLPKKLKYVQFDENEKAEFGINFSKLIEEGKKSEKRGDFFKNLRSLNEEDVVTLIYTSGTTGDPKGVMLTHDNILSNSFSALDVITLDSSSVNVSILPLSHALEKTCSFFIFLFKGATIAICDNLNALSKTLRQIKPSHIIAVPKLYESIYQNILKRVNRKNALVRKLFVWGLERSKRRIIGAKGLDKNGKKKIDLGERRKSTIEKLADSLIFKNIRKNLGGNIKLLISGGAPLPTHIGEFFNAVDMPLIEGYGLTEASPVVACNRPDNNKIGTVGQALSGVAVKTNKDGELLVKGTNVMKGYYNLDDATKNTIDEKGWLHTGDIAEIDEEGFISITDRKKDIIVTSGGKNVSPQNIEAKLLANRYIKQAIVVGEGKDFMSALIVPDPDTHRSKDKTGDSLDVESVISNYIKDVNTTLSNYEKIRKFKIIDKEFSIEDGELTPTFKIRRSVIKEKYSSLIGDIYGS